jgi:DNA-binding transcriptional LysR family regulator
MNHEFFSSKKFAEDKLLLLCGPLHPFTQKSKVKLAELSEQNFIFREKGSGVRAFFESILQANRISINVIWESVSTQAMINAVARGIGLAVLPELMVKDALRNQDIVGVPIADAELHRNLNIVYHKNKFLTENANRFTLLLHNKLYRFFD